jgi:diaminopimelate epimerase
MKIRFTKMQGAGNDFVMLDGIRQRLELTPERVRRIADRRFGVGADQVLVVEADEPATGDPVADFRYRIFNADGGEVEQCGNGARCFLRFVRDAGLCGARAIRARTLSGVIEPRLEDDGSVTVDMGPPDFLPAASGFDTMGLSPLQHGGATLWPLAVASGCDAPVCVVSMGNPHAVQFVADVEVAPVGRCGPAIERHARFSSGVNAGFAQSLGRGALRLRVWERGTGETLACGTGACAAAVAGISMGVLDSPVRVSVRGGELLVRWEGGASRVFLSGPAEKVFEGEIDVP